MTATPIRSRYTPDLTPLMVQQLLKTYLKNKAPANGVDSTEFVISVNNLLVIQLFHRNCSADQR